MEDEDIVNIETDTGTDIETSTETISEVVADVEAPKKEEECKPCKLNIGAAMMITICKDIAAKDSDFEMNCEIMEKELTDKEDKVASTIIEDIYNAVMEKGTEEDKEIAKEIYDLSHGKGGE